MKEPRRLNLLNKLSQQKVQEKHQLKVLVAVVLVKAVHQQKVQEAVRAVGVQSQAVAGEKVLGERGLLGMLFWSIIISNFSKTFNN